MLNLWQFWKSFCFASIVFFSKSWPTSRILEKHITLSHLTPMFHFCTPLKRQITSGFQLCSEGIEMEHWREMVDSEPRSLYCMLIQRSLYYFEQNQLLQFSSLYNERASTCSHQVMMLEIMLMTEILTILLVKIEPLQILFFNIF